jgi:RNA polymerase sigma factor (sigma-70 family)
MAAPSRQAPENSENRYHISADLVQRALSGKDPEAENELWSKVIFCAHSLARIALREIHGRPIRQEDSEDIEDIVQNAILKILCFGPENIRKKGSWNSFLGRAVHYEAVNFLERQERHRNDPSVDDPLRGPLSALMDTHLKTLGDILSSKTDVRKEVTFNEMRRGLAVLSETLSERNARILCLYLEGLKPRGIAKEVGISPGAVSERIFWIKLRVREWYNWLGKGEAR